MNGLRTLPDIRRALGAGRIDPAELLVRAARWNERWDAGPEPIRAFLSIRRRAAGPSPDDDGVGAVPPAENVDPGTGESNGTPRRPLEAVPIGIKDNIATLSLPTTCGSRILQGYRSPFEATAVRRLRAAGARIFGKTNCDEFAMGSSTENSAYGPTRNPVDRSRVPGGSSGGSAAAVAAGVVPAALGSETGGSVRQPAAFCGVVGIKPTYGRVSRYGLVAFASSLDQIGVLANTVSDGAEILEVVSGYDRLDATSQDRPVPRASALDGLSLSEVTLGVPREYLGEGLDVGIGGLVERTLALAAEAGATIREVSLPMTRAGIPCYYVIAPAEASSNLARFDGVRYGFREEEGEDAVAMYGRTRGEGFGVEVKRRIMLGTYVLSAGYYDAYYRKAQALRRAIAEDFRRVFADGIDALFTPTTPTPAFELGAKADDPYAMYLADVYTVSANLAGIPAVSIPIGNLEGLPVGGQLMCPEWEEERMLAIARRLEERLEYEHPVRGGPR